MNGPDHYTRAEEYLNHAQQAHIPVDIATWAATQAQAHATLALAAAVVNSHDAKPETPDGWRRDLVQHRLRWDDEKDDETSTPVSPWARAFANDPTASDDERKGEAS